MELKKSRTLILAVNLNDPQAFLGNDVEVIGGNDDGWIISVGPGSFKLIKARAAALGRKLEATFLRIQGELRSVLVPSKKEVA